MRSESGSVRGGRPPGAQPRWSAGRRSAPEAGGSRERIVLWRAPRPKRERVVTFARVARPTTLAPPGAPFPREFGELARWLLQNSGADRAARTIVHSQVLFRLGELRSCHAAVAYLPRIPTC